MPARIDEVNGDAVLYVVDRTPKGCATIAVQTDECKAMYFELDSDDVRALTRDLGAPSATFVGQATGCEHPECIDPDGGWHGCTMVGLEHRMEGAHDGE